MLLLFDIQTGVSGDMILGALFDLGLDFETWNAEIGKLGFPQARLSVKRVSKHGIAASKFYASLPPESAHRGLPAIGDIILRAGLPQPVSQNAVAVFTRLALAEARVHGIPVERVHFHEVGALDAIVDIVGACLGFHMLGVKDFYTTPFVFGTGTVDSAHGRLAEPVPATVALSEGFPTRRGDLPGELCTPTGTAIVTTLAKPLPSGFTASISRTGYGAGTRELPGIANVLRLCLMEAGSSGNSGGELFQIECNLDNMTPELVGYAAERLMASGCLDAWQEPVFMKKNRSAVKLCALAAPAALEAVLTLFAAETSTGGVRYFPVRRLVGEKSAGSIETRFGTVALKGVAFPGRAAPRWLPEFESCRDLAARTGTPLQDIYREASALATLKNSQGEPVSGERPA